MLRKVAALLDARFPDSESQVFEKAAHAPFISHPREFCDALLALKARGKPVKARHTLHVIVIGRFYPALHII